jgi:predicted alpha/beta hydrolase family esterase
MKIVDPVMAKKMAKALKVNRDVFDLDDIREALRVGKMQGHTEGDTWAITQVHEWPRQKSVNILYVIGSLDDALKLESKITEWAKSIGANFITAVGRDGWWEYNTPGWKKMGVLYSKDL